MIRALVLAVTALTAPAGWKLDHVQTDELGKKLGATDHFGLDPAGQQLAVDADVYVPGKPGVVLSVVRVTATTHSELAAAARAAVDDLHASSQRAALAGSGILEDGWQEKVDAAAKQIEATLAWRDTSAKTSSTARLVIAADAEHIVSVTGECFAADDAEPGLVEACKAALATLDPGIAADARVPLALAPAGTRPARTGPIREPARMDDGSRVTLPPITVPQDAPPTDRRSVYVGIGLVVMAGLFWWNRHRRARREEEPE